MKICLLGDTHFGVRNDSLIFHDYFKRFFNEHFFPYLLDNDIKTIIQLGDLFDRRKYINFLSLTESRKYFFDRLVAEGITLHALIGNHDIFWKHSLEVNSPNLLLKDYSNIVLWQKPGKLIVENISFDMIPWICNENEKEVREFISQSISPYCIGHFELNGFSLMKGVECHDGMSDDFLANYDQVFSGHFHTRSNARNVSYLGTPYELFWSDYKDAKGFHVFDTETTDLTFIENPYKIFHKISYDDAGVSWDRLRNSIRKESLENTYIKVIVVAKEDPYIFDMFMDELYKQNPADVVVVEDFSEGDPVNDDSDEVDQAQDTMTILSHYIDQQDFKEVDNVKLKNFMRELYIEAISIEENFE
jgi:DNA repair exonuclease SbcCD nuclease subunit